MMVSSMSLTVERTHVDLHRDLLLDTSFLFYLFRLSISYLIISYLCTTFSKNFKMAVNVYREHKNNVVYIISKPTLSRLDCVFYLTFTQ